MKGSGEKCSGTHGKKRAINESMRRLGKVKEGSINKRLRKKMFKN